MTSFKTANDISPMLSPGPTCAAICLRTNVALQLWVQAPCDQNGLFFLVIYVGTTEHLANGGRQLSNLSDWSRTGSWLAADWCHWLATVIGHGCSAIIKTDWWLVGDLLEIGLGWRLIGDLTKYLYLAVSMNMYPMMRFAFEPDTRAQCPHLAHNFD